MTQIKKKCRQNPVHRKEEVGFTVTTRISLCVKTSWGNETSRESRSERSEIPCSRLRMQALFIYFIIIMSRESRSEIPCSRLSMQALFIYFIIIMSRESRSERSEIPCSRLSMQALFIYFIIIIIMSRENRN